MEKNKIEISIIIPFYNEEENINRLFIALEMFFSNLNVFGEVVFVNDGSTDNSLFLLKKLKANYFESKLVNLSKNFGSHAALRAGLLNCSGKYICFMNADLQDPLELIISLYNKCNEGNNIVWAYRNNSNNNFLERKFSQLYSKMMKKYAISNYPDKGYDIVMFTQNVQKLLNSNIEANSSIHLQILTLGFRHDSIGYEKQKRQEGKSKWTISKKIKLFIDSFVSFSYFPIRIVSVLGIFFFVIGLIWTLYIVYLKIVYDDLMIGWPTLISVLMLGFGITNISLGIIAEYLWRTLDSSRKRPVFIIDEVINLNEIHE